MNVFNTYRKNLLPGKRFQKYLLYAIGEIILVVVGILIALQVNNYKEQQSNNNEVDRILSIVAADLEADRNSIDALMGEYERRKRFFDIVLAETPVPDSIQNCEGCRKIFTNLKTTTLRRKGANLLKNHSNIPPEKAAMIGDINAFYTRMDAFLPKIKETITEIIVSNVKYLRDHYDWFSALSIHNSCTSGCHEYFEGGTSNFQNRVAYLHIFIYENYLPQLTTYKKRATTLLKEIEQAIAKE